MTENVTQWFVHTTHDLTRQMVFDYLNSIGASDNAEELGKECSDGKKKGSYPCSMDGCSSSLGQA